MSEEIFDRKITSRVYGGLVIDIAEEGFAKAEKLLSAFPGGAQKAVGSALARAGKAGQTEAKRAVTQEYTLSGGTFLANTRNINHFERDLSVTFGYAGSAIPLVKFSSHPTADGVVADVRRDTGSQVLPHAFFASMHGRYGIFERLGTKRLPVHELYGPATPSMMYSNEAVLDAVEQKVADTFDKRIDHEISRIINGWGG